jgi:hypothetical protein
VEKFITFIEPDLKKKNSNIFLFFFLVTLCACKKYPEDRGLFLKNPQSRITKHHWQVAGVLYNETEINHQLNDSLILGEIENLQLEFQYQARESGTRSWVRYTYNGDDKTFSTTGLWELENKDKDLYLTELDSWSNFVDTNAYHDHLMLNNLFKTSWSILKLNKSELKIKNIKGFEIRLKSVK